MRKAGYSVIFDATHSVQRQAEQGLDSGDGRVGPILAKAAMAAGCDGIFMEVHENPARAFSDGSTQIPLKDLPKHLRMLKAIMLPFPGRGIDHIARPIRASLLGSAQFGPGTL